MLYLLSNVLSSVLAFLSSSAVSLALNEFLSVLRQSQFGDANIGGLHWHFDDSSLLRLLLNLLNVETPLPPVDSVDLSTGSLVASSEDFNCVVSSDRQALNAVFLLKLCTQWSTHQSVLDVRRGCEMSLALLSLLSRNSAVELHVFINPRKNFINRPMTKGKNKKIFKKDNKKKNADKHAFQKKEWFKVMSPRAVGSIEQVGWTPVKRPTGTQKIQELL